MAHDVKFTVPKRPLGVADIEFEVRKAGRKVGTLCVSRGSVVWFARNNTIGHKLRWQEFDELMQQKGRRAERR